MIGVGMWTSPHVLLEILVRCSVVYAVMLTGFRLMGKREIGQMTAFDLVLLLLISNAVQNAMTGPDTSLSGGIVAAASLFGLNLLISRYVFRHRGARRWLLGTPTLLIRRGEVIETHLKREGVTREALLAALREHGVANIGDVSLAVLEMDGSISVLKRDDIVPSQQPHRHIRFLNKHQ